MRSPLFTLSLCFTAFLHANAGVVLVAEERLASDETGKVRRSTVWIGDNALRMDGVRGRELGSLIYLSEPKEFILLDKKNQSYRRLPRTKIEAALGKAQEAIAQIRQKAGELAPDKSEKVTQLLDAGLAALQKAADSDTPHLTYTRKPDAVAVGPYQATQFEGGKDGAKMADLFTVPVEALGVPPAQLQLLNDVRGFFDGAIGKLTGVKSTGAVYPAEGSGGEGDYSGIPVRRIRYDEGAAAAEWLLKEVRVEEVPASTFEIPAEYKEKPLGLPVK